MEKDNKEIQEIQENKEIQEIQEIHEIQENRHKKEKKRFRREIVLTTKSNDWNEFDENENNQNVEGVRKKRWELENLFFAFSRKTKKFFRVFMWKMIYLCSEKTLKNLKKEIVYEMFLAEVKKEKLQEIRGKSRKIIIYSPDGRDIFVNLLIYKLNLLN